MHPIGHQRMARKNRHGEGGKDRENGACDVLLPQCQWPIERCVESVLKSVKCFEMLF